MVWPIADAKARVAKIVGALPAAKAPHVAPLVAKAPPVMNFINPLFAMGGPPPVPKAAVPAAAPAAPAAAAAAAAPAANPGVPAAKAPGHALWVRATMPQFPIGTTFKYAFVSTDRFNDLKNGTMTWTQFQQHLEASPEGDLNWRKATSKAASDIMQSGFANFMVPWLRSGGMPFKLSFQYEMRASPFNHVMGFENRVPRSAAYGETMLVATSEVREVQLIYASKTLPNNDFEIEVAAMFRGEGQLAGSILGRIQWLNHSGSIEEAIEQLHLTGRFDYVFFNDRFHRGEKPLNGHNMKKDMTCLH